MSEFITAKEFRKLDIDGLLNSIDVAIEVLRDKYVDELLPDLQNVPEKFVADALLDYKEKIGSLAKKLLDIIF